MKFSIATLLAASSLVFSPGAFAAMTPTDVTNNVVTLTTISASINTQLIQLDISTVNFNQVETIGTNVVAGFQSIVTTIGTVVTQMSSNPPLVGLGAACDPVVAALLEFVRIHQALLSTVISKHSIFAQFGGTAPITAILRALEGGIDALALGLIALIPCASTTVSMGQNMLDTSVRNSIALYSEFCIPSLLFPAIPPVCFAF
ncbi:hypothetical protein DFH09DRAFT_1080076 [Mycena vulgaris]|nr:hypothetical protein DFH09DRAFT_1080076 [Mycena vulgaris]